MPPFTSTCSSHIYTSTITSSKNPINQREGNGVCLAFLISLQVAIIADMDSAALETRIHSDLSTCALLESKVVRLLSFAFDNVSSNGYIKTFACFAIICNIGWKRV